jgi:large conductance mechanosensitive channel
MLQDFRDFINRGNVIDLAIGLAIGAAFTAIINSLVGDIFMPLVGALMGGINFEDLAIEIGDASINYGLFIQAIINFLVISVVIFLVIRAVVSVQKELGLDSEVPAESEPEPQPSEEVVLLTEIRDLMKERQ